MTARKPGESASGGAPPVTWSVSAGTLPAGLALNASTGVISGTVTLTAQPFYDVTVIATAGSADDEQDFDWYMSLPTGAALVDDFVRMEVE